VIWAGWPTLSILITEAVPPFAGFEGWTYDDSVHVNWSPVLASTCFREIGRGFCIFNMRHPEAPRFHERGEGSGVQWHGSVVVETVGRTGSYSGS
jgi:hypothetical protein